MTKRVLGGVSRWLLRVAEAMAPAEKSEWIKAVLAEADSIEGGWNSLSWAMGAVSFACRCRVLVSLGILREELPMNRSSLAFASVFALVLCLFFAVPTFRDAAKISSASARFAFGNRDLSDAELRRMADKAEQRGDASTMAFVAMRLDDSRQAMQLGKRAIALNPSLSWIRYFIIKHEWSDLRRAGFGPETQEVIAADPDNALGYLLRAEWIRRADGSTLSSTGTFHQPAMRAEWEAAMEKAFAAPAFDDYMNRKVALDREVSRTHKLPPFSAAWAMVTAPIPDLFEVKQYGDQLIASGDTPSVARAVRFGGMFQNGQTAIERIVGRGIRARGLAVLEKEFELPLAEPREVRRPSLEDHFLQFAVADASVVQTSLLLAALATVTVLLSMAALLIRRRSSTWQRLLRDSAIVGVLASIVAFVAYLPFAACYAAYLRAGTALEAAAGAKPFLAFYFVPNNLHAFFASDQAHLCFWWALIIMAAAGLLWRVVVYALRARTNPA